MGYIGISEETWMSFIAWKHLSTAILYNSNQIFTESNYKCNLIKNLYSMLLITTMNGLLYS